MLPTIPHAYARAQHLTRTPVHDTLRTHRQCAPEHARLVELACRAGRTNRDLLPRRHQDDRGGVGGLRTTAPDGAYAKIPAWLSRDHWLSEWCRSWLPARRTAWLARSPRSC